MFYMLNVIKVQCTSNISGLCNYIQTFPERSRLCAGCTSASAADTFDLQQVSNGDHGCVQVRANGPDFYRR